MALKKRKWGENIEYEFIDYERDQIATFNKFSVEEFQNIRTLMRHVGGVNVVAYELYKFDKKMNDTHRVHVAFRTIINHADGDKTEVLTVDEYNFRLWEHRQENDGQELNHTVVGDDVRVMALKSYFERSPRLRKSYKHKVNMALNWNRGMNKDTKKVINLLDVIARRLHTKKENSKIKIERWLMPRAEDELDYDKYKAQKKAKMAIDKIKITSKQNPDETADANTSDKQLQQSEQQQQQQKSDENGSTGAFDPADWQ